MHLRSAFLCAMAAILGTGATLSAITIPVFSAPDTIDTGQWKTYRYDDPIDALSIGFDTDYVDLSVSALIDNEWTEWESLEIEKEFDPLLRESNMVMFPKKTSLVRVAGITDTYEMHPIRISDEPVHYSVAATSAIKPKILSRSQWGADESLMYTTAGSSSSRSDAVSDDKDANGGGDTGDARVDDCMDAQNNYPNEFKVIKTIAEKDGKTYRWKLQYSKEVKLIAVHHTAGEVTGDPRSAVERMRAFYAYHSLNRGWGDIGYHYVIDEKGQIYEGKAGGDFVVGGHAYCNNIGTLGVALMGNFDKEVPPQAQMKSLQWLLDELASRYNIDPEKSVKFHGKTFESPIVAHGDLVSTACPGYFVRQTLSQVRTNVENGTIDKEIAFPLITKPDSGSRKDRIQDRINERRQNTPSSSAHSIKQKTLMIFGSSTLTLSPGAKQKISLRYTAGANGVTKRTSIADVQKSNGSIGVWQTYDTSELRVRNDLFAPAAVKPNTFVTIQVTIQAPSQEGEYSIDFGDERLTMNVQGRRVPTVNLDDRRANTTPTPTTYRPSSSSSSGRSSQSSSRSSVSSSRSSRSSSSSLSTVKPIRIKVTTTGAPALKGANGTMISLYQKGNKCDAFIGQTKVSQSILRFTEAEFGQISVITPERTRTYRGTIECRVVDNQMILINELPLEDYMLGLGEEPDTEPYEKQRAFAIAARTYARFYMEEANRKFPGKPYDGSDSPAEFQLYIGMTFEKSHPNWLKAVHSTGNQILTKNNQIIKPPYFSSDNGKTKTPAEAGWKTFPFAEIFTSKPDPWCDGMENRGHGVGMSGCGAEGQAHEGKSGEQILQYYYPGTAIIEL